MATATNAQLAELIGTNAFQAACKIAAMRRAKEILGDNIDIQPASVNMIIGDGSAAVVTVEQAQLAIARWNKAKQYYASNGGDGLHLATLVATLNATIGESAVDANTPLAIPDDGAILFIVRKMWDLI